MRYVFEDCVLDTDRRELRRGADLVAVEPQVFDLLVYLVQNRERVVSIVKEKTGRNLRLDAPMSLSFFPWLGIRLEKVALDNPPGFGAEPFATVGELDVRVRLLPLLDGQVVASTIKLDGLSLDLRRLADGRDNWSDLVKPAVRDGGAEKAGGPAPDP